MIGWLIRPSCAGRELSAIAAEWGVEPEEAARRLGYRPHMIARGLQSGRTATIGVVAADLGNPFVTPIIHGITASMVADAPGKPGLAGGSRYTGNRRSTHRHSSSRTPAATTAIPVATHGMVMPTSFSAKL